MSRNPRRHSALLTALALLLAIEAVTAVAVRAAEISDARAAEAEAAWATLAAGSAAVRPPVHDARRASDPAKVAHDADLPNHLVPGRITPAVRRAETAPPARPRPAHSAVPAKATTRPNPTPRPAPLRSASGRHVGRNHVWSPALGIDRAVYAFPCSRSQKPGNVVYRWGCAGRNNVYLLGHAANVFGGLDRAYSAGRLKPGLKVWYADARGTVRTYAVRWWKVVKPTPDAAWAWDSLSRPSMTLQTCLGAHSEYRLMVRLTQVD